ARSLSHPTRSAETGPAILKLVTRRRLCYRRCGVVTSSANDSPTGARWFVAGVFGLWALFFVLAWLTPVLLDDWYQLTWHRHYEFGLASIWEYAHYNYFHFNPRVGDVL